MKNLSLTFAIATFIAAPLAMAESGGDRTFARMEQARAGVSIQTAKSQGVTQPVAELKKNDGVPHDNC